MPTTTQGFALAIFSILFLAINMTWYLVVYEVRGPSLVTPTPIPVFFTLPCATPAVGSMLAPPVLFSSIIRHVTWPLLILPTISKLSRLDWYIISFYIDLISIHLYVVLIASLLFMPHQQSYLVDFISATLIIIKLEAHHMLHSRNVKMNMIIYW